ncbi:MAG: hypothetical protein SFU85_04980 [Candidatus Methylacidiphilales bacterium]|nr:hypothetical protein [Candidatus Methylacidiphilales bacterium]
MKKLLLHLPRLLVASTWAIFALGTIQALQAQTVLLNLNFNSDTVGNRPAGSTAVEPVTNTGPAGGASGALSAISAGGDVGFVTTDRATLGNTGSGNALRVFDMGNATTTAVVNFGLSGASTGPITRISFDFAATNFTSTLGTAGIRLSFGNSTLNAASSGSTANLARLSLVRDATTSSLYSIGASNNTSGTLTNTTLGTATGFSGGFWQDASVLIFINDEESTQSYTQSSSTYNLAADTYDVWVNGTKLTSTPFALRSDTGQNNRITALSIASQGTTQAGADWIFDNLNVQSIPEPGTGSLLAGGLALMVLLRRSLRRHPKGV